AGGRQTAIGFLSQYGSSASLVAGGGDATMSRRRPPTWRALGSRSAARGAVVGGRSRAGKAHGEGRTRRTFRRRAAGGDPRSTRTRALCASHARLGQLERVSDWRGVGYTSGNGCTLDCLGQSTA